MEENKLKFMSDEIDKLAEALSQFQSKIEQPKLNKEVEVKTKTGGKYNFKYSDFSECKKSAAPHLVECGLAVTQIIQNGYLITLLLHKSGQYISSTLALDYEKLDGFQSLGSAITYLKRYSYCAILGIVADDDDDGNFADGNTTKFKESQNKTSTIAFTGEQLKQALAELESAKTNEEYQAVWIKWSTAVPAICKMGTEFYKACEQKYAQLQQK